MDARTKWSAKFMFRRVPKIKLALDRDLVVLDLSSSDQFVRTMSEIGGFSVL